jgi:hypothetical protein
MMSRRGLVWALAFVLLAVACHPVFAGNRRRGRRGGGGTAAGAAMAGEAKLSVAAAQAQAMQAQAAKTREEAKAAEIRNRLLAEQAAMRRALANQRHTAEPMRRDVGSIAHRGVPPPLLRSDLDPETGAISYPPILSDHRYDVVRGEVDRLFRSRVGQGSLELADRQQLESLLEQFHAQLRTHVGEYAGADYGHAATFLERLRIEAGQPMK